MEDKKLTTCQYCKHPVKEGEASAGDDHRDCLMEHLADTGYESRRKSIRKWETDEYGKRSGGVTC